MLYFMYAYGGGYSFSVDYVYYSTCFVAISYSSTSISFTQ